MPNPSGFAQGKKVTEALSRVGVVPSAWVWRWRPGVKGGVFPPHLELNKQRQNDPIAFGRTPQHDVNGDYCECQLQTVWRDERGFFAKSPVVASVSVHHDQSGFPSVMPQPTYEVYNNYTNTGFSLEELKEAIIAAVTSQVSIVAAASDNPPEIVVNVQVPDFPMPEIVVNVPQFDMPTINIDTAPISIDPTPVVVNVEAPNVQVTPQLEVAAPTINVEPTPITVSPQFSSPDIAISVEPTPVTISSPDINLQSPEVNVMVDPTPIEVKVEPQLKVAPADVTVNPKLTLPAEKLKKFRVIRDADGLITGSEEV